MTNFFINATAPPAGTGRRQQDQQPSPTRSTRKTARNGIVS